MGLKITSKIFAFFGAALFGLILSASAFAQDFSAIKTVVIDAGHGGKDPGCHGSVHNEKTVCLNMALKLGELISLNYPDVKVIYTRKTDVFIELDERAKIANRNNADLFICIHANAASPQAAGTETYVLGLHRTESQQKIAERENASVYLEEDQGQKYKDFILTPDAIIARQLQLSVFLDQSISFATKLQNEFAGIGRYNRGVKQAGFIVLYKTTMPSVLIETGFLTNPEEERFLGSEESQTLMAEAMFGAFRKYKSELEGVRVISEDFKKPPKKESKPVADVPAKKEVPLKQADKAIDSQVEFRVQIETSETKVPLNNVRFKNLPVQEYFQDGLYKYTSGKFVMDYDAAQKHKNELRQMGFAHAFVVAFLNGERIDLQKGINLAKK